MADTGTDISGYADIDPYGAIVTGDRIVAESLARRLSTPRGRVIDDPDYGYDLTQFINDDVGSGANAFAQLRANAAAECLKDERVLDVKVDVAFAQSILTITVKFTTASGPFSLVLAVSQVSVTILSVT